MFLAFTGGTETSETDRAVCRRIKARESSLGSHRHPVGIASRLARAPPPTRTMFSHDFLAPRSAMYPSIASDFFTLRRRWTPPRRQSPFLSPLFPRELANFIRSSWDDDDDELTPVFLSHRRPIRIPIAAAEDSTTPPIHRHQVRVPVHHQPGHEVDPRPAPATGHAEDGAL